MVTPNAVRRPDAASEPIGRDPVRAAYARVTLVLPAGKPHYHVHCLGATYLLGAMGRAYSAAAPKTCTSVRSMNSHPPYGPSGQF
jgi:hypothetical protein